MRGRAWIVATARTIAIAILERTDTAARTPRDEVAEEADSPLERWRALVAVAAPSLLDGNDEDAIWHAGSGDSSPRHASTTTAVFEPFGRRPREDAPRARDDAGRETDPSAPVPQGSRRGRRERVRTPSSPPNPNADAPFARTVAVAAVQRGWDPLHDVAPALGAPSRSGDRPDRTPPPVAEAWGPLLGGSPAPVDRSRISAVVAAVRDWSPRRRQVRRGAAVQRQDAGPVPGPDGITPVEVPAPSAATTVVPQAAACSSPAHHRPGYDGGHRSFSPAPGVHPAATPETGRLQLASRRPPRTDPRTPRHTPDPYTAVELTLAPAWPALPPSPLDRDGVAPNRLPAAVASASPGPDAFAARWSAEREAR